MNIYDANYELIKIGNAMVIKFGIRYYVTPRTVKTVKPATDYECFMTVDEAFNYAKNLPSNWCMDE